MTSPPVRDSDSVVRDVGWAQARLDGAGVNVEQSRVVSARPEVPALDVRVYIEGGVFLGSGDDGLVFRTVDESDLLYGHGVWVDADGRRARVVARHVEGGVALLVPKVTHAARRRGAAMRARTSCAERPRVRATRRSTARVMRGARAMSR